MAPLPKVARSSAPLDVAPPQATPVQRAPARQPRVTHAPPRVPGDRVHVSPPQRRLGPRMQTAAPLAPRTRPAQDVQWPATFDDWMIDIVRRRAMRLNSGARRRGVGGSVRAAELGQILAQSADARGNWICALCHEPVTLNDLSFDHVIALADGGEHAAHNLVPAHRKCNEIKGSEKAQHRAHAVDRWLNDWATTHGGARPRALARHPSAVGAVVATAPGF